MLDEAEKKPPVYSLRALLFSTFLCGPLAFGILMRKNCVNLYKEKQGNLVFYLSIVVTVLIFVFLFSLSEQTIDKIPRHLLPLIQVGLAYLVAKKMMGNELKEYELNKGPYYSGWRAFGFSMVSLVILTAGIAGYFYSIYFDSDQYNAYVEQFQKNEEEALNVYNDFEALGSDRAAKQLKETTIYKWNENASLVKKMEEIRGLPENLHQQDAVLANYCQSRIEEAELILKGLQENTNAYDAQIGQIQQKIETELKDLEKINQ